METSFIKGAETVYVKSGYGNSTYKAELVRVTPSGQTVIKIGDREKRFDKKGWEIGSGSSYYKDFLITKEVYLEGLERAKLRKKTYELFSKGEALKECFADRGNYLSEEGKNSLIFRLKEMLELTGAL